MGRHHGIQHSYRMREIADEITRRSGVIQENWAGIRRREQEASDLKREADKAQRELNALLELQTKLIECQMWTEFGLPSGMTPADFKEITGHEITT